MATTCLFECLAMSGNVPNEMTFMGNPPDLDQGINEFVDSLRCSLVASDGLNNVSGVFS